MPYRSTGYLPYGRQSIDDEDVAAVVKVLKSDFLTTGPQIKEFEIELASAVGAQEAVVVGNGTQALHLACLAAGLGPGDAAIVPTVTFLATANAVRYCGAEVIFADVDGQTGLMNIETFEQAINSHHQNNIKAVLPVHLGGQAADLKAIRPLADAQNIRIIADSCHALGGRYGNRPVGAGLFEDFSVFSFHPVKTIAMGEGGAITTNDRQAAMKMRNLRTHGMELMPGVGPWAYQMKDLGFNYRATDMQCALGRSQLRKLSKFIEKRQALARFYDELLAPLAPSVLPPYRMSTDKDHAWHLYAVRINFGNLKLNRVELMEALKEQGIGTQVHYIPVHTQPYYVSRYGDIDMPGSEEYYQNTLSLPLFPSMKKEDVERVVGALKELL